MKILLLGEFSALHKNLKEGLQELGHQAIVAGGSDGFKKIPVDVSFDSNLPGFLQKIDLRLKMAINLLSFKKYDVVQLINPFIFQLKYFPTEYFLNRIARQNRKLFLLAAGDDAYFWRYGRKLLKYGPFEDFLQYDLKEGSYFMESEEAFRFNKKIVKISNGVIPVVYELEVCYQGEIGKCLKTIPIPINTSTIKFRDNRVGKKMVVFHGLNRYGFKGTRLVEAAFECLNKKHPNDLELIIDGKMPLKDYLEVLGRSNVVIDQMHSHSLGMNGVYALAMGKVVMGGAEPESLKSLGVAVSPVINLKPNVQSIIDEVEKLLEKRDQLPVLGLRSREFAEQVHGHRKVAQQYIETWTNH